MLAVLLTAMVGCRPSPAPSTSAAATAEPPATSALSPPATSALSPPAISALSFAEVPAADGTAIAYAVAGHGEQAVILSHCWGGSADLFLPAVRALSDRYRFIVLDLPGHGRSGATRRAWTVAAYAGDLETVARAAGAERPILVGHSMSGRVVVEAALGPLAGRVRGLVFIDAFPDVDRLPSRADQGGMLDALRADFPGEVRRIVRALFPPSAAEGDVERVAVSILRVRPDTATAILEENLGYPIRDRLPRLSVPVWSINADLAPTNERANQALVPGWRAIVIPRASHWPMIDAEERFAEALSTALEDLARR
ncbi:alpha/beta fold hydrolase [Sorangium sp. So ce1097]|uniref:alpha/beta fold hydrolase n=1 Tax=Sorangium sp. So ce1097 TaxID=3133330 RepID=UPI003F615D5B